MSLSSTAPAPDHKPRHQHVQQHHAAHRHQHHHHLLLNHHNPQLHRHPAAALHSHLRNPRLASNHPFPQQQQQQQQEHAGLPQQRAVLPAAAAASASAPAPAHAPYGPSLAPRHRDDSFARPGDCHSGGPAEGLAGAPQLPPRGPGGPRKGEAHGPHGQGARPPDLPDAAALRRALAKGALSGEPEDSPPRALRQLPSPAASAVPGAAVDSAGAAPAGKLATGRRATPDTQAPPPARPSPSGLPDPSGSVRPCGHPLPLIRVRLQQPQQEEGPAGGGGCSPGGVPKAGNLEHEAKPLVVEPDHYYDEENGGRIPVFKPTWDQFKDFSRFVDSIRDYGFEAGIVKVIPPPEWVEKLPDVRKRLPALKVRHPITQHFFGRAGVFQQANFENRYNYSLSEFRDIANKNAHVGAVPCTSKAPQKKSTKRAKAGTRPPTAERQSRPPAASVELRSGSPDASNKRHQDDVKVEDVELTAAGAGGSGLQPDDDAAAAGAETKKEQKSNSSMLWMLALAADSMDRVSPPPPTANDCRTAAAGCQPRSTHVTARDAPPAKRCKEEHTVRLPSPRELFGGWPLRTPPAQEFRPAFGPLAQAAAGRQSAPVSRPYCLESQMRLASAAPPLSSQLDDAGSGVSLLEGPVCAAGGGYERPGPAIERTALPAHGTMGSAGGPYGQPLFLLDPPISGDGGTAQRPESYVAGPWHTLGLGDWLMDTTSGTIFGNAAIEPDGAIESRSSLTLPPITSVPARPGFAGTSDTAPAIETMCTADDALAPGRVRFREEERATTGPQSPPVLRSTGPGASAAPVDQKPRSPSPASFARGGPSCSRAVECGTERPVPAAARPPGVDGAAGGTPRGGSLPAAPSAPGAAPGKKFPIKIRAKLRIPEAGGRVPSQKAAPARTAIARKRDAAAREGDDDEEDGEDGDGPEADLRRISEVPEDPCNTFEYTVEKCKQLERDYWRNLTFGPPMYGADLSGMCLAFFLLSNVSRFLVPPPPPLPI
ncbi:MAG: hypothetical protein BJ554DRAFT_332 [Olpidium bornovanus]|uniref:JmjN domain-containing protein n=1 Tax=Olpidium bornovanus TaxID=278681 RepID=A0A8H7ZTL3_9FUNG|nr:MAG: hypothetical protein BJ554DRAFT_332 [Olpidium bornovanus]